MAGRPCCQAGGLPQVISSRVICQSVVFAEALLTEGSVSTTCLSPGYYRGQLCCISCLFVCVGHHVWLWQGSVWCGVVVMQMVDVCVVRASVYVGWSGKLLFEQRLLLLRAQVCSVWFEALSFMRSSLRPHLGFWQGCAELTG